MNKKKIFKIRYELWLTDRTCYVCQQEIESFCDASLEHIIPRSKGGSNEMSNLSISHKICNRIKGNSLHPRDWENILQLHLKVHRLKDMKDLRTWRFTINQESLKDLIALIFDQNSCIGSSFKFLPGILPKKNDANFQEIRYRLISLIKRLQELDHCTLIEILPLLQTQKTQRHWRLIMCLISLERYLQTGEEDYLHTFTLLNSLQAG